MRMAAVATAAGVAYALGWLTRQPQVVAARREASTDALTGLVNRSGLKHQLRNRARRGQPYTIYMIDLNGFKRINDTFGHRAGDELLRQLGYRLAARFAEHLVARLGGDEFIVVGDGLHRGPQLLTARIAAAVEVPIPVPGSPEPVTLSTAIGLSHVPVGADPAVALHAADLAMYLSKVTGIPRQVGTSIGPRVDESPRVRVRDTRPVRVA